MSNREQKIFSARLVMLPDTADFTQDFCDRHDISHDDAMRLRLIIEELFTNTVQHGYRGESDAPISVTLHLDAGAVTVLYEDSAPRYDPLAHTSGPGPDASRSGVSRPVGGLGVYLVSKLVERPSYAYEDGFNRLRLTLLFAP